jgi:N-acetylmuramoyl-L-alanine amidase
MEASPISAVEATEFVQGYYGALTKGDIPSLMTKFADSVAYGDDRLRDRTFIEKDLRDYLKHWPTLKLNPNNIVTSARVDGTTAISFTVAYAVANEATKRSVSGNSKNDWIVQRNAGQIQIVSQREVVHPNMPAAQRSPAAQKSPAGQSHEDEETLSDEELKNEPQVDIPTSRSTPKPSPRSLQQKVGASDFVVALDIGHTPLKGGAVSARGIFEYKFNRRLATELFAHLQSLGYSRSFVINPAGDEITLRRRSAEANQQEADLFLAIHHDSVKDRFLKTWEFGGATQKYCDDFHGYSIFFSNKNPQSASSLVFSKKLGQELIKAGLTPTLHHVAQENRPIIDKEKGVYAFDDLVVLKTAKMPAVLLECGVIVNRAEEEQLNTAAYRNRLVDAIGRAIQDFSTATTKNN